MRASFFIAVLAVLALGACSRAPDDRLILGHAASKLGVSVQLLRVTPRTDLDTDRTHFYLVTRDKGEPLTVVDHGGALFDDRDPGAFDRVAHGEDAVARISRLGAERVALWFAALGQGVCGYPASEQAHFVHVAEIPEGTRLSYVFGGAQSARTCVIELQPDGHLLRARAEDNPAARVQARGWDSDKPSTE